MLIRDGKEYRNLQQQVAENTDDIAELKQGGVGFEVYSKSEADAKFATKTELTNKQDTLVSGTNIKTINNQSLLGEGNITIESGDTYTAGTGININSSDVISVDNTVVPYKTDLATVATSGSYNDLSNKPDLSVYETKAEAFSGSYTDLTNKPDLSVYETKAEAFSGNYNDLTNKPTIPHAVAAGTGLSLAVGSSTDTVSVDSTYVPAQVENQLTLSSNNKVTGICGYNIASSGVCVHYIKLHINTANDKAYVTCTLITNSGTQFNFSTLETYLKDNSIEVAASGQCEDLGDVYTVMSIAAVYWPGVDRPALSFLGYNSSSQVGSSTALLVSNTITVTDTVIAI